MSNFHPLEVVGHVSETQLQVVIQFNASRVNVLHIGERTFLLIIINLRNIHLLFTLELSAEEYTDVHVIA